MPGNVLFITVDQWRGDCLSSLGHPVVRTPTLDRLAAGGVTFTRHWANTAPCGPSRATLYTGMYVHNHRSVLNGTPLDARFTNVALEARSVGYDPVLFGYTDSTVDPRTVTDPDDPRLRSYEGVLPGFRVEELLTSEDLSAWARWLTARGVDVPDNPAELHLPIPDHPKAEDHAASWAPTRFAAEHSEAAFLTDAVTTWLDRHDSRDDTPPWFAHVSYIRPHPPYRAPEGYHDLYDPADGPPFRRHANRETETASHLIHQFAVEVVGCPVDEAEARQLRATYWGNMAEVDHQLGRLLDRLDASGQADDTLVVITSDHGDQMGDHWLVGRELPRPVDRSRPPRRGRRHPGPPRRGGHRARRRDPHDLRVDRSRDAVAMRRPPPPTVPARSRPRWLRIDRRARRLAHRGPLGVGLPGSRDPSGRGPARRHDGGVLPRRAA
jgi:arylsulfatase A-like enzyme